MGDGDRVTRTPSARTATASAAAATLIVGGSVPLTGLLAHYPLLTGQAVRYLLGALALWGWLRAGGGRLPRLGRRDLLGLAGMVGAGMLGFNALILAAERYATPGFVAAVLGASPLVLALAVPLLRGHRPSPRAVLGAVLVVAGVVVLTGGGSWRGPGLLLALLVLVCEVMFTLCAAGAVRRHGAVAVSTWGCLIAAGTGAVLGTAFGGLAAWRLPTPSEAVAIVLLGLVVTAVAFAGWYTGVSVLGADRAGVLIGLMPLSGLVVSVALGAQGVTAGAALGAALVTAGCVAGLRPGRPAGVTPHSEVTPDPVPLGSGVGPRGR